MMGGGLLIQSLGLGVGLAMDAFSVSIADGLADPKMRGGRKTAIAGTFAFFQFLMPVVGWLCVHTIARQFAAFEKAIPWIAIILLVYIGGKMIVEGRRSMGGRGANEGYAGEADETANEGSAGDMKKKSGGGSEQDRSEVKTLGIGTLLAQGLATSIDALSVGFAFASYALVTALICSAIIGVVTFVICMVGLALGNRIGGRFTGKAEIVGGIILIFIGLEIFVRGVFL